MVVVDEVDVMGYAQVGLYQASMTEIGRWSLGPGPVTVPLILSERETTIGYEGLKTTKSKRLALISSPIPHWTPPSIARQAQTLLLGQAGHLSPAVS